MAKDDFYARVASTQAQDARALAVKGQCESALGRLILANVDGARADYGSQKTHHTESELSRAQMAFVNMCLRGGAKERGLRGARRKKRRR